MKTRSAGLEKPTHLLVVTSEIYNALKLSAAGAAPLAHTNERDGAVSPSGLPRDLLCLTRGNQRSMSPSLSPLGFCLTLPGSGAAGAMPRDHASSRGWLRFPACYKGGCCWAFWTGTPVPPCRSWTSPDKSCSVFPCPMQAGRAMNRQPGTTDVAAGGALHWAPSMRGTGTPVRQINSNRAKGVV